MGQKRHGVDEIIPKLRRADVELGKGKKVPEVQTAGDYGTDVLPLASEVRRYAAGYGEGIEEPSKGECSFETNGCESSVGYGDIEGSGEGKLVSPERRRRTIKQVRRRLGPQRISERRACRVLGQPRRRSVTNRVAQLTKLAYSKRCERSPASVRVSVPSVSIVS